MTWPQKRKSPAGTGPIRQHTQRQNYYNPLNRFADALARVTGRPMRNGRSPCPACGPKSRSFKLSITESCDGKCLVKCFSGCTSTEIVAAVGLQLRDLFPPSHQFDRQAYRREKSRTTLMDQLTTERLILAIFDADVAAGKYVSAAAIERAGTASRRVAEIRRQLDGGEE